MTFEDTWEAWILDELLLIVFCESSPAFLLDFAGSFII